MPLFSDLKQHLGTRLAVYMVSILLLSLILLIIIYGQINRRFLLKQYSESAIVTTRLLETGLENAMLKSDLHGLMEIVNRLSDQTDINSVSILNAQGKVRFQGASSLSSETQFDLDKLGLSGKKQAGEAKIIQTSKNDSNEQIRVIKPVLNKSTCQQCHGNLSDNPINGYLLVDYDVRKLMKDNQTIMWGLIVAALFIVALAGFTLWWFIKHQLIKRVKTLANLSQQLSAGNLEARSQISGNDEISALESDFNNMANQLAHNYHELKIRETFLQSLIDAVPDAIRVINKDYKIIASNRAYAKLINADIKQIKGQYCYYSSHRLDHPCPASIGLCPLREHGNDKFKSLKYMQEFTDNDNNKIQVQITSSPLLEQGDSHQFNAIVESIRDLSTQVVYSHQSHLASLGELAAGVAHEIHNPLSSIRIAIQSTLRACDKDCLDQDKLTSHLKLIDDEITHCVEITNRLLKLSRLAGEKFELIDINSAVQDISSLMGHEAQQRKIKLQLNLDQSEPRIMANESDLRIIILNLLQNAFVAMESGGIAQVTTGLDENRVYITISDTGTGIKEDIIDKIFDPFFSKRPQNEQGVGLGLAIVKSLAEHHKAQIKVENLPDSGASFTLSFNNPDTS